MTPGAVGRHPVVAYCLLAFTITWGTKFIQHILTADGHLPAFNVALIGRAFVCMSRRHQARGSL